MMVHSEMEIDAREKSWVDAAVPPIHMQTHTHTKASKSGKMKDVGKGRSIAKRREEIPSNAPNRRSNLHFRLFKPAFRKHYFHFRFRWTLVTEPCINLWRYSGESDYTARNNRLQPKMKFYEMSVTRHAWGDRRVVDENERCYLLDPNDCHNIFIPFNRNNLLCVWLRRRRIDAMQDYSLLVQFFLLARLSIYQFN